MKILITNNHLNGLTGTETWCFEMKHALEDLGHLVELYSFEPSIYGTPLERLRYEYDLILVNHRTCEDAIRNIKGFKIFTRHAFSDEIILEQSLLLCDAYVCVSEEIKEKTGYKVITNGVNVDRFKDFDSNNYVLSLCKGSLANEKIKQACSNLDMSFINISGMEYIEEYIKHAAIVFSYGRGCLESLSCNKQVFVYDSRNYQEEYADGLITIHNIDKIAAHNFSGRWLKAQPTIEEIETAIKNNWNHNTLREYIVNHHNIKDKVNQYLKIYEERNLE